MNAEMKNRRSDCVPKPGLILAPNLRITSSGPNPQLSVMMIFDSHISIYLFISFQVDKESKGEVN